MSIAVVTDSTADIPGYSIQEHKISVIPALLNLADKTYLDGIGLSREEFYQLLPQYKVPPTTASPSIVRFQEMYEQILSGGVSQIISIHVASAFSSIYNIACSAAEAFQGRVHVVDSMQVTLGLGFQVITAAEAAARGANLEEILRLMQSVRQRVKFIALLDTLEYIRRSGRVSWASAAVSSLLSLKVMIEVKMGEVHRLALFRTRQQGLASMIQHLSLLGHLDYLALMYTLLNNPSELTQIIEKACPQVDHPTIIGPVTTVIGTHVGSNGVGFIALSASA